jgi:hypothetical protein
MFSSILHASQNSSSSNSIPIPSTTTTVSRVAIASTLERTLKLIPEAIALNLFNIDPTTAPATVPTTAPATGPTTAPPTAGSMPTTTSIPVVNDNNIHYCHIQTTIQTFFRFLLNYLRKETELEIKDNNKNNSTITINDVDSSHTTPIDVIDTTFGIIIETSVG